MSTSKSASATLVLPHAVRRRSVGMSRPSLHFSTTCPHRARRGVGVRQGTLGGMGLFDRFRRGSRARMRRPARRRRPHRLDPGARLRRAPTSSTSREFVDHPARGRGVRRAAHRGQRRDAAAGRPRRRVDPPPGAVGRRGRTSSATATRCRRTTPPWSASRSGCATTTAARSRGAARRASASSRAARPGQRPVSAERPRVVDQGRDREAGAARRSRAVRRRRS